MPRGALLAFATQVEERVIDTDRKPDHDDHEFDAGVDWQEQARNGDEADAAENRSESDQEWHAGRHKGAERDHQR